VNCTHICKEWDTSNRNFCRHYNVIKWHPCCEVGLSQRPMTKVCHMMGPECRQNLSVAALCDPCKAARAAGVVEVEVADVDQMMDEGEMKVPHAAHASEASDPLPDQGVRDALLATRQSMSLEAYYTNNKLFKENYMEDIRNFLLLMVRSTPL
jgi:hypothetical protein